MRIYPYNPFSASAKALAKHLDVKRVKHNGRRAIVDPVIINWGASKINRALITNRILNPPGAVAKASNKLETFKALNGRVDTPSFTTSLVEASKWLAEGLIIVERHKLTGHSGEGIRLVHKDDKDNTLSDKAKLYVKYIPKRHEYRLHVFRDKVFFVQRKARNKDVANENVDWKIRNHGNGFIYAHQEVDVPDEAKQGAIMAINLLGLDFGAVDMIYNEKHNKYYVLEVNTACGLHGETLNKYGEIFQQFK